MIILVTKTCSDQFWVQFFEKIFLHLENLYMITNFEFRMLPIMLNTILTIYIPKLSVLIKIPLQINNFEFRFNLVIFLLSNLVTRKLKILPNPGFSIACFNHTLTCYYFFPINLHLMYLKTYQEIHSFVLLLHF